METRFALITDALQITECNKRNLPLYYSSPEHFYFIISSNHEVAVITHNSQVIGFIIGEYKSYDDSNSDSNFHILSFGIDKKYRRRGLGSKLIKFIIKKIKNKCNSVSLYVHYDNTGAISFYEKYGFQRKELLKNYYRGNLKNAKTQDALLMKKIIS